MYRLDPARLIVEASELRLPVGQFPATLVRHGVTYSRSQVVHQGEDLFSVLYTHPTATPRMIEVLND